MGQTMEWTRSTFTPHPEGVFKAQFVEWAPDDSGQFGQQVKLTFDTEEEMDDGRPFRISVWTKPSLHEKGRVAKLLKAFGESAEEVDLDSFDLDDYIGRKCQVVIEHYRGQDGSEKAKIANFLPLQKGRKATEAAVEGAPESGGDRAATTGKGKSDPKWDDEE